MQAIELLDWTGLSRRTLSEIVGTTHPTFGALVEGHSASLTRHPEVIRRIADLHALAGRLAPFELREPGALARALLDHGDDGQRIADLAVNGSLAAAYRRALQVLAPSERQPLRGPMVTRTVGTATASLTD